MSLASVVVPHVPFFGIGKSSLMDVSFHAGRCRSIFSDLRGTLPVSQLCILKGKQNELVVYYFF
jgi:hypothetical protein